MIDKQAVCKNCGNRFEGKFCNQCGEKIYTDHDKSIPHFFEEAFHFITHFEGTFFTTIRTIFSKPGKLSLDYCNGLRKKYFKPLPLFMLLVVVYLVFPVFPGLNMPFQFYLNNGSMANRMVTKHTGINMDSLRSSIDQLHVGSFNSEKRRLRDRFILTDSIIKTIPVLAKLDADFNKKSPKISKILLLILLPLTAFVCWLLALRKKRYFFDHLVVSTEINAFYLLIGFFLVPAVLIGVSKLIPEIAGRWTDAGIGWVIYGLMAIYCSLAIATFYGDKWWWAILKALVLLGAHFIIVQVIYKFILFALTFYFST